MPDLNQHQQLLAQAVAKNDAELTKLIITEYKVDVDFMITETTKSRLIHVAVENGDLAVVQFLLSHKPQLNYADATGKTPLAIAVEAGREDIAETLLKAGADINATGTIENSYLPKITGITALHVVAAKGNFEMLTFLLFRGAEVNAIKTQTKNPASDSSPGGVLFKSHNTPTQETALDIVRRGGFKDAETLLLAHDAHSATSQNSICLLM